MRRIWLMGIGVGLGCNGDVGVVPCLGDIEVGIYDRRERTIRGWYACGANGESIGLMWSRSQHSDLEFVIGFAEQVVIVGKSRMEKSRSRHLNHWCRPTN